MTTSQETKTKSQVKITSEIVTITPEQAQHWLDTFNLPDNRNIAIARVNQYAKAMRQNEWEIGDALKFNMEGMLIDGQHRLMAVVKSKIPTTFLVLRGYEQRSAAVLDRGNSRNMSSVAQLAGEDWVKQSHISIFNALCIPLPNSRHVSNKLTDKDKIHALVNVKDGIIFGSFQSWNKNGFSTSVLSGLIARAYYSNVVKEKGLLHDFVLLAYGYDYVTHSSLFSQTEMSPQMPSLVRQYFLSKPWIYRGLETAGTLREQQYNYCQSALLSFLKQQNKKRNIGSKKNLFPVPWIDDYSFNNPDLDK